MSTVIEARHVSRSFTVSAGFLRRKQFLAVNDVSLQIEEGSIVGLVGESGCGKSTMAQMLLGLLPPSAGEVFLGGKPTATLHRREIARMVQPVFQDPYSSLNPRATIGDTIALPLRIHRLADAAGRRKRTLELMDVVGLPARFFEKYPNQLSGGQRQRVAIARALITRPALLICDEPTSALDVSIQAQILNLLMDLQAQMKLTMLLISHNLAVVEHMTTKVAVMYKGQIVEEGPTDTLFASPQHTYTKTLLDSVLTPEIAR